MKQFILATGILGAVLSPAVAADAIVELPVASVYNWSGAYIGVQIGGEWGKTRSVDTITPAGTNHALADIDSSGFIGGVHAGYNYQMPNNIVLGGEADFEGSALKGDSDEVFDNGVLRPTFHHSVRLDWQGSARLRVGYAMDRLLPYVTGGLAFGHYSMTLDHGSDHTEYSGTSTGWTVGAGLEYAFTDHLTTRIEYRYTDFGSIHGVFDNFPSEELDANLKTHAVRLGLSYKF